MSHQQIEINQHHTTTKKVPAASFLEGYFGACQRVKNEQLMESTGPGVDVVIDLGKQQGIWTSGKRHKYRRRWQKILALMRQSSIERF